MKLKKILMIIAVCTVLTACGSNKEADSVVEVTQETTTKKEDKKADKKKAKEIKISGSGELTEEMVSEILEDNGIKRYDEDSADVYEMVIEDGFTIIGEEAFYGLLGMQTVMIPDSVKEIDSFAFKKCSNLQEVTIPEGVTKLGGLVFSGCSNLQKVVIPDSITEMGNGVFKDCISLQEVKLSENLTGELDTTFLGCTLLQIVIIPEGVTELLGTFGNCTSLRTITIPEGVTTVSGFANCTSLQSITLPKSVTKIGGFMGCTELTEINIPENVELIDYDAFSGCSKLVFEKLHLVDGIVADGAFKDVMIKELLVEGSFSYLNEGFKEANIEKIILEVGEHGSKYLHNLFAVNPAMLTEIVLCDGFVGIGEGAFKGLTELKSITIPASVTEIHSDAFWDCSNLTIYTTADSAAEYFAIRNGEPYELIK